MLNTRKFWVICKLLFQILKKLPPENLMKEFVILTMICLIFKKANIMWNFHKFYQSKYDNYTLIKRVKTPIFDKSKGRELNTSLLSRNNNISSV